MHSVIIALIMRYWQMLCLFPVLLFQAPVTVPTSYPLHLLYTKEHLNGLYHTDTGHTHQNTPHNAYSATYHTHLHATLYFYPL